MNIECKVFRKGEKIIVHGDFDRDLLILLLDQCNAIIGAQYDKEFCYVDKKVKIKDEELFLTYCDSNSLIFTSEYERLTFLYLATEQYESLCLADNCPKNMVEQLYKELNE